MCLCNNNIMNSKQKMRLYFLLELVIWLLIIIVGVSAFRYHSIKKQKELKTYQIFLQDVDGLIVGSPVRMMGVPIGYINNIKIIEDHIYVKFVLTDKSVTLPQGVIATVEFNGMGGSKSLELYPPDEVSKASGHLIAIKQTNRLGAALGLLNDMFDKLGSIIVRCQIFNEGVEKLKPEVHQVHENPVKNFSISVNQFGIFIDALDKKRIHLRDKIKGDSYEHQKNQGD